MPLALTPKSVVRVARRPSRATAARRRARPARSGPRCSANTARPRRASRMSTSSERELRESVRQALGDRPRGGARPEEARAHVVLEADHAVARLHEVLDGLGADQAARAGDDRLLPCLLSKQGGPDGALVLARSSRGCRPGSRARRAAAASPCARTAARSRTGRSARRRDAPRPSQPRPGCCRSARGRARWSRAATGSPRGRRRRWRSRPAQCSGSRQLLLDQVDQVVHVQKVPHLLARAAIADVAQVVLEVVAQQPVG